MYLIWGISENEVDNKSHWWPTTIYSPGICDFLCLFPFSVAPQCVGFFPRKVSIGAIIQFQTIELLLPPPIPANKPNEQSARESHCNSKLIENDNSSVILLLSRIAQWLVEFQFQIGCTRNLLI